MTDLNKTNKDGQKLSADQQKINQNEEELAANLQSQEQCLNGTYIDALIQENDLAEESINQLNTIKQLLAEHNATIDTKRLKIKNNLVCIDGYTLPTGLATHYYKNMKNVPEGLTYPGYAKALLTFAADITGTAFTFPANRDRLQKKEIDGKIFKKEINTLSNQAIIKTLHSIVGFDSIIPVGLDKDGYVIGAVVRSDACGFGRDNNVHDYDFLRCLVSAT